MSILPNDKKRADALAATVAAIAKLTTTKHETKDDFIKRVRLVLSDDPDQRYQDDLRAAYIDGVNASIADGCEIIEAVAHRTCSKYKHGTDGRHSYTFEPHTLAEFVRRLKDQKI